MKFYDPHPGLAGCPSPLPEEVRSVLAELDGTEGSLDDAMHRISQAVKSIDRGDDERLFRVFLSNGYIGLEQGSLEDVLEHNIPCNCWRLIRFTA